MEWPSHVARRPVSAGVVHAAERALDGQHDVGYAPGTAAHELGDDAEALRERSVLDERRAEGRRVVELAVAVARRRFDALPPQSGGSSAEHTGIEESHAEL